MQPNLLVSLRSLSDVELVARVRDLATRERDATVLLVAHLAELDTREVHYRAGHGSLFAYCRDVLGLSEQEAYNRIAVARATRRFPVILELLDGGSLNLTSVRLLAPHLTPANHRDVLEGARGKSKAQVEEIAAALWPRPDAPSFVRKLPAARPVPPAPAGPLPASGVSPVLESHAVPGPDSCLGPGPESPASVTETWDSIPSNATSPSSSQAFSSPPSQRIPAVPGDAASPGHPSFALAPSGARRSAEITPLSPDRYRVQVTIGGDTLEKLRLVQDLLRHALPSGDEAAILDRALTALLADLAQKKFAATERPRPSVGAASGSRHVPAEVKRTVWLRDLGRCAFLADTGRRCMERGFLEFHHVTPYALGGEATAANIQLRCRNHNAYEARLYFGNGNASGGASSVRETATSYGLGGPSSGPSPSASRGVGRAVRTQSPGVGHQKSGDYPDAARMSARQRPITTSQRYSVST